MRRNRIDCYIPNDQGRYFSGSLLPFIDQNGRNRLAKIERVDDGVATYRCVLLSKTGVTEKTFRKSVSNFLEFSHYPKYVEVDGNIFYVCPSGKRTMAKGYSPNLLDCWDCRSGRRISLPLKVMYEYCFSEDLGKNGRFKEYIYGVKV